MGAYHDLARAFEIFGAYPGIQSISAEHDEIYAGPDVGIVSPEHVAELERLGWLPCEYECFRRFT
jgi:hypothetical protein